MELCRCPWSSFSPVRQKQHTPHLHCPFVLLASLVSLEAPVGCGELQGGLLYSSTFFLQHIQAPLLFQAPETSTVVMSPIKSTQEEHTLTPPGKVIAISTRSPGCARNQPALRNKTFSPGTTSSPSGERGTQRGFAWFVVPAPQLHLYTCPWKACEQRQFFLQEWPPASQGYLWLQLLI